MAFIARPTATLAVLSAAVLGIAPMASASSNTTRPLTNPAYCDFHFGPSGQTAIMWYTNCNPRQETPAGNVFACFWITIQTAGRPYTYHVSVAPQQTKG
ncbi:hypothetical protein, partial [Acrocarpospora phusangensis]|uniref:hypothetical protein n=1 Tax=Acrocarpospora phusangensis TaxID=1070424 RepID=UPI00195079F4